MDITLSTLVPAVVVLLAAATLSGITGFGLGLIAVPLLTIFLPPQLVVPVLRLHALWSSSYVLWEGRSWVRMGQVWPVFVTGCLGLPVGTYLLVSWNTQTLKLLIGAVTALSALSLLCGIHWQVRDQNRVLLPVGFIGGTLSASTGMGGPPIALFYTNQRIEKSTFRANLAAYFLLMSLANMPLYVAGKLITPTVLAYTALLLPALIIGTFVGIRLSHRFREQAFRQATLLMVMATGLIAVVTSLGR